MEENKRRLPTWMTNQSVSSSTSAQNSAGSSANENDENKVKDSECSNGAGSYETPSSSEAAGPLRVSFSRDQVADSCRNINGENGNSDNENQVVSGTSDEPERNTTGDQEHEQVHSTSEGGATGCDEPDSSHDVTNTEDGNGEVESSGINPNQEEVSSAQPPQPRESCFFGTSCYRQNPQHRQGFSHPGDPDYVESSSDVPQVLPICKYGQGCYRQNPKHRREYNHDINPPPRAARPATLRDGESSSDDDFGCSSSDDFDPGSETDDSFVVPDSFESGTDSGESPNKDDASQNDEGKQTKRRRKKADKANKKNKH